MPRSFGLPQLGLQPFGTSPQQPLSSNPMDNLTPEQLAQMLQPYDEQRSALNKQMDYARALQGRRAAPQSSAIGGLFGGIANALNGVAGTMEEQKTQSALDILTKKQGEAQAQTFSLTEALKRQREEREVALEREKLAQKAQQEAAKIAAYGRRHKGNGSNQEKGPKALPPSALAELSQYDVAAQQVNELFDTFGSLNQSGALAKAGARATNMLGLQNTDAAAYNAKAAPVRQAVGTILEGGKMAAGDEEKYRKMLPEIGDSPEVAAGKRKALLDFLSSGKARKMEAYKSGGYKVAGDDDLDIPSQGAVSHGAKVGRKKNDDGSTTYLYEDGFQETVK